MLRKYSFDGEMEAVSEPNLLSDIGVVCVCVCVHLCDFPHSACNFKESSNILNTIIKIPKTIEKKIKQR